jgi:hypothetical protein
MSWIDKELKRRASGATKPPRAAPAPPTPPAERLKALWGRIERTHDALPATLRLDAGPSEGTTDSLGWPPLLAWYRAADGAVLGLAADGIRYVWPQEGKRRSHNFWIRWDAAHSRFVVTQRVGAVAKARLSVFPLDVDRVEQLVKGLVVGRRVRPRSLRKKLWGLI